MDRYGVGSIQNEQNGSKSLIRENMELNNEEFERPGRFDRCDLIRFVNFGVHQP